MRIHEGKVHFVEMVGMLERAFGLTNIPSVRDDLDVEPLELSEKYDLEIFGKIFAEDIADKTAFELSKRPADPKVPRVNLGTGALIMYDGKVISGLKGDFGAAISFLHTISGESCSVHLAASVLSKATRGESQYFQFAIPARRITESDLERLRQEVSPSDTVDFLDLLIRFEREGSVDMNFLREKYLGAECRRLLLRHIALVPTPI